MGDKNAAVIEIDLGDVLKDGLCKLFVDHLARGEIGRDACLVEQLVDFGLAIAHRVLRCVAFEEDVGIAVRIGASAPRQEIGLIVALLGLLERGGKFRDADLHIDFDFAGHRLNHFGDRLRLCAFRHHEIDIERRDDTGLLQECLGLGDVALRHWIGVLIIGIFRVDPLVARLEFAVEHDLVQRFAIDCDVERLAYLCRLPQRILRRRPVVDVDVEPLVAELERCCELQALVGAHILDVGRQHALDQVKRAGLEVGEAHR